MKSLLWSVVPALPLILGVSSLNVKFQDRSHANQSALVAITHYVPAKRGGALRRNGVLRKTLTTIREWPGVDLTIIVLTNAYVPEVRDLVSEQIVVSGEPVCSESWQHKFCMPWEAIRAMRTASTGGRPSTKLGQSVEGELKYDYYVYTESDIKIPERTFHFWRAHVNTLYTRGYLLLPLRAENKLLTNDVIAVDCYKDECVEKTEVLRDDEGDGALYHKPKDRHYLRPFNPYSGCFLMNRAQFGDYLGGPMWDYHETWTHKYSPWGIRETAASGLLWDPRFGNHTGLTHLRMTVWHQIPMNGVGKGDPSARIDPSRFHKLDEYALKVSKCINGSLMCAPLTRL